MGKGAPDNNIKKPTDTHSDSPDSIGKATAPGAKRLIRNKLLRHTLKALLGIIIFLLLTVVAIYIPPIQTLLKNIACSVLSESTGMNISIERFRLKFPLDISLEGVTVIDAAGDTMVVAKEAIADVKLPPLLDLDVKLETLKLKSGEYRMVSADSSMIMRAKLANLEIFDNSGLNISTSDILLSKAKLSGGDVNLYMNVWKTKKSEEEAAQAAWKININDVEIDDINFSMSMLPTIDTLDVNLNNMIIRGAAIDLEKGVIKVGQIASKDGKVRYLTPTAEYIASHPLPIDSTTTSSAPMEICVDSIDIDNYDINYGVTGAKVQPGFDPANIALTNLSISLSDFYNRASDIKLHLTNLVLKERCGLNVTSGQCYLNMDSIGIDIDDFNLTTSHSALAADAYISFGMMQMQNDAPVNLYANGKIGFTDIYNFIPTLKDITKGIPTYNPLQFDLQADGSLSRLSLDLAEVTLKDYMRITATGNVKNLTDIDRMSGDISLNGNLANTSLVNQMVYDMGVNIPPLSIEGDISFDRQHYIATVDLTTESGNIVLDGDINLSAEEYYASLELDDLQMKSIMPSLGIGLVSGELMAEGSGFNPVDSRSWTDISINISQLEYADRAYGEINAHLQLENGDFNSEIVSFDPFADIDFKVAGHLAEDNYILDATLDVNHLDLYSLGVAEQVNAGSVAIKLSGEASPNRSLYDIDLNISKVDWALPDKYIYLPAGLGVKFKSETDNVALNFDAPFLDAAFNSQCGLDSLLTKFTAVGDSVMQQIDNKRIMVNTLKPILPKFDLRVKAVGGGMMRKSFDAMGLSIDSLGLEVVNSDKLTASGALHRLNTGTLQFDTITLNLNERGRLLDYRLYVGNRKGNLDEFAKINLNGYIGGNRMSASLTQKNVAGQTGYRLGMTAALLDSAISVHFTPLNATIAYMPWELNEDNHVEYYWNNNFVDANLQASSDDSQIHLNTALNEKGENKLDVKLANIRIEDFLKLNALAPPIKGSINSDMTLTYKGNAIVGSGNMGINSFTYDRQRVGDFNLEFGAGLDFDGNTAARIAMYIDNQSVLKGYGIVRNPNDSTKQSGNTTKMALTLNRFPLKVANAFIDKELYQLQGELEGNLEMTGSLIDPHLNGKIKFSQSEIYLPIIGSSLKMDTVPVVVADNVIKFNKFGIRGANTNNISIDGIVNAKQLSDINFDMKVAGKEVLLINNDKRAKSDIYGKLFMTLSASAKGNLKYMDINANASVLPATDIYYTLSDAQSVIAQQEAENVVKFVSFSDTTRNSAIADSVSSIMNMRLNATLNIVNGAKATVNLSEKGTDRIQLSPSGSLTYNQSYMGDTRLNGQLNLGTGYARYTPPLMGEKLFTLQPDSYILWNGDMLNPILNIKAVNSMKANVRQDGQNSRNINFDISLAVTNTLSSPKITFDVSTEEDATVQNELQSMSSDQRSNQAMNMLITNSYAGSGAKSAANLGETALYSFLTSKLNSWAANNIRGVDLSFGIDQYENTIDGRNKSTMSYSYQLSKSLFDNRFKIVIGGNYSTDAAADENFAQNLISDISFEYMLKQTNNISMYLKLFRHTGYESILEGEITETGVGFVMKRRLSNLRQLFRFRGRKSDTPTDSIPKEDPTLIRLNQNITSSPDSIMGDEIPTTEGYDILN